MTRVCGLPEPRHKSQLCLTVRKSSAVPGLKLAGTLTLEINAESSILERKVTSRASVAQGAKGLRLHLLNLVTRGASGACQAELHETGKGERQPAQSLHSNE